MKPTKYMLLLSIILSFQANARAEVALQFTNFSLRIDQQTTFGWSFTLSMPVFVTHLGYFDFQSEGLTDAHPVAIWGNAGGSPLVSATVPAGTSGTLLNGVRYIAIDPVLLPAGTYTIGGYSPNFSDSVAIEAATITTAPGITYNGARSAQGVGLMFPSGNTQGYANGDFGPNFQFAIVPEPSVTAMLVTACCAAGLLFRRRYRQASSK